MSRTIPALLASLSLVFITTSARADEVGTRGTLAALQVNTDSADTFLLFNGRLFVSNLNGNLDEYRWGGASCGSRVLTEEEVATLQRALHSKQVYIQPVYQIGQFPTCLVGFTMIPKKSLKLAIP